MYKNPLISIIVPIYGVEQYLEKCINSIINQTYRDLEIILIDDGSPDRCGEICDRYAQIDARIVVIHQKNQGVSAARNAGLDIARGEYIAFCDSDDYVAPNMYQRLLDELLAADAQLAICNRKNLNPNGISEIPEQSLAHVLEQQEVIRHFWDIRPSVGHGVWNKLYVRSICNHVRFTAGLKSAEDAEFLGLYLLHVNKAVFINEPFYIKYQRDGSAQRGMLKSDSVLPCIAVYNKLWVCHSQINPDIERHIQSFFLSGCIYQCRKYCLQDEKANKQIIRHIRKMVRKQCPSALFNNEIYLKSKIIYWLFCLGYLKK